MARRRRAARGRQRSAETEQAILQVTRELLVECGVQGLTIEKVAARAGVAKTTIYRRWRDKDELALAVVLDMVEQVVKLPDLGDTRAELLAFVNAAVKVLGSTLMGRVMQGLVSDLATDPELAQAFRDRVVSVRDAEVERLVERGIARGDLRARHRPRDRARAADRAGLLPAAAERAAARPRVRETQRRGRAAGVRARLADSLIAAPPD